MPSVSKTYILDQPLLPTLLQWPNPYSFLAQQQKLLSALMAPQLLIHTAARGTVKQQHRSMSLLT